MDDVFISYARADRDFAARLATRLAALGLTVWWDTQLLGGDDYRAVLFDRLRQARAVAVIWSDRSAASRWVCEEAEEAANSGKIVAIAAPGFDLTNLPLGFRSFQTVPIGDVAAIHAAILARQGRPAPATPRRSPGSGPAFARAVWRNRPRAVAAAAVVAAMATAIALLQTPRVDPPKPLASAAGNWSPSELRLIALAHRFDGELHAATDLAAPPLTRSDLARPLATIEDIRKLDPNNANVPYFTGVVARWLSPPGPCYMSLGPYTRYLELEQAAPRAQTQTLPERELCYNRPYGYCTQRTAWVHHQLAWDFIRWGRAAAAPAERRDDMARALANARSAIALYPPTGFPDGMADKAIAEEAEKAGAT